MKGFTLVELLVVIVIMALLGMQVYIKRGISGRLRDSADQVGDQYSPDYTFSNYTTVSYARINETQDAWSSTTRYDAQWTQRTGEEHIGNFAEEYEVWE